MVVIKEYNFGYQMDETDRDGNTPADYGYKGENTNNDSLSEAASKLADNILKKYKNGESLNGIESTALIMSIVEKRQYIPVPRETQRNALDYFNKLNQKLRDPAQDILDGHEIDGEQLNILGAEIHSLTGAAREIQRKGGDDIFRDYKPEEIGDTPTTITNLTIPLLEIREKHNALLTANENNRAQIFSLSLAQKMFTNVDKTLEELPKIGFANSIGGLIERNKPQLDWSLLQKRTEEWFSPRKASPPTSLDQKGKQNVEAPIKAQKKRKGMIQRLRAVASSAAYKVRGFSTKGRTKNQEQNER